jgi:hypothetical protein
MIAAKGRLRCVYPGPAIAVSEDRVLDHAFREAFFELIFQLDSRIIEEACLQRRKRSKYLIHQTSMLSEIVELAMTGNNDSLATCNLFSTFCTLFCRRAC